MAVSLVKPHSQTVNLHKTTYLGVRVSAWPGEPERANLLPGTLQTRLLPLSKRRTCVSQSQFWLSQACTFKDDLSWARPERGGWGGSANISSMSFFITAMLTRRPFKLETGPLSLYPSFGSSLFTACTGYLFWDLCPQVNYNSPETGLCLLFLYITILSTILYLKSVFHGRSIIFSSKNTFLFLCTTKCTRNQALILKTIPVYWEGRSVLACSQASCSMASFMGWAETAWYYNPRAGVKLVGGRWQRWWGLVV